MSYPPFVPLRKKYSNSMGAARTKDALRSQPRSKSCAPSLCSFFSCIFLCSADHRPMSDLNTATAAPPGHLELDMLQTLLMHAPDLLSTRELGRLSLCSKTLSKISDDAGVWKCLFDKAAAAGETCVSDGWRDGHVKPYWNGEPGILSCFAHPSPQIL